MPCTDKRNYRLEDKLTAKSRDGRDGPFSDWLRSHPDLESNKHSLDTPDIDHIFHKFRSWVDGVGDRRVKLIMDVEIKTYGKHPNFNQMETLYFHHQLLNQKRKLYSNHLKREITVWSFGHFVLVIYGGARPDQCDFMEWGNFDNLGILKFTKLSELELVSVLRFDVRPDTFAKLTLRRHHKTSIFGYEDHSSDLLFPIAKHILKRS